MTMDDTDKVPAKLRTIRAFLEEVFLRLEVSPPSPVPESGNLVWSFSVIENGEVKHSLHVSRKFLDDHDDVVAELRVRDAARLMRRTPRGVPVMFG
jgi:hypothetical protein